MQSSDKILKERERLCREAKDSESNPLPNPKWHLPRAHPRIRQFPQGANFLKKKES